MTQCEGFTYNGTPSDFELDYSEMMSPSFHEFMQACVAKVQEGALNRPIMRAEARGAGSTPRLGHVREEKRQASSCTATVDALLLQNLAVLLLLMLKCTAVVVVLSLLAIGCFYATADGGWLAADVDPIVSSYCCLCCLCICANAAAILDLWGSRRQSGEAIHNEEIMQITH